MTNTRKTSGADGLDHLELTYGFDNGDPRRMVSEVQAPPEPIDDINAKYFRVSDQIAQVTGLLNGFESQRQLPDSAPHELHRYLASLADEKTRLTPLFHEAASSRRQELEANRPR